MPPLPYLPRLFALRQRLIGGWTICFLVKKLRVRFGYLYRSPPGVAQQKKRKFGRCYTFWLRCVLPPLLPKTAGRISLTLQQRRWFATLLPVRSLLARLRSPVHRLATLPTYKRATAAFPRSYRLLCVLLPARSLPLCWFFPLFGSLLPFGICCWLVHHYVCVLATAGFLCLLPFAGLPAPAAQHTAFAVLRAVRAFLVPCLLHAYRSGEESLRGILLLPTTYVSYH